MSDTDDLNAELLAAIPPDMHPYAYAFMHVQFPGVLAKFEPDELNALGRHIERLDSAPPSSSSTDTNHPSPDRSTHTTRQVGTDRQPGRGDAGGTAAALIASLARTVETEEGGS
ncbi:hypothetical protein GS876_23430 [Rhodococcus hoagii]|nr:hypothetical protein [Prescottella equi]